MNRDQPSNRAAIVNGFTICEVTGLIQVETVVNDAEVYEESLLFRWNEIEPYGVTKNTQSSPYSRLHNRLQTAI